MVTTCNACQCRYDDEFRSTICPHDLFPANDGQNNFTVHHESKITPPPFPLDFDAIRSVLMTGANGGSWLNPRFEGCIDCCLMRQIRNVLTPHTDTTKEG